MKVEDFTKEIERQLSQASSRGAAMIRLNAGDIHRAVGGYPSTNHAMPSCCAAMYAVQAEGDRVISAPPSGKGASLTIEYALPRPL